MTYDYAKGAQYLEQHYSKIVLHLARYEAIITWLAGTIFVGADLANPGEMPFVGDDDPDQPQFAQTLTTHYFRPAPYDSLMRTTNCAILSRLGAPDRMSNDARSYRGRGYSKLSKDD